MKVSAFLLSVASLALATCLIGCSAPGEEESAVDISAVRADLQVVSRARVLLGHQSVGRNILQGVQSLADEGDVPIRIEQIDGQPADSLPGLFHSFIGHNGDPDSKCEVFAQLLNAPGQPAYDLAMMKFCYEDLSQGASLDPAGLLERYSTLVRNVRAVRPDVPLMHVTMPLRADPPGWKTTIKRILGRSTWEDADNALRNAFNAALRARFSGEPIFDLAEVESTLRDGSRSEFSQGGHTVYTLAREYTTDGGHLNANAQRRVAAAFLHAVALTLQQRPAGTAPSAGQHDASSQSGT